MRVSCSNCKALRKNTKMTRHEQGRDIVESQLQLHYSTKLEWTEGQRTRGNRAEGPHSFSMNKVKYFIVYILNLESAEDRGQNCSDWLDRSSFLGPLAWSMCCLKGTVHSKMKILHDFMTVDKKVDILPSNHYKASQ